MSDDRLSIAVEHADGRITRWGYDEVDGKNIPTDLSFGTKIPGGYEQMQCSLLRRLDQDHPDLDPFDTVTVYGPGGQIAYQGRHVQFPRSHGDSFSITPGAVGWASHLRDDQSFHEIYVDRDFSHWQPMSLNERIRQVGVPRDIGAVTFDADATGLMAALPNQALAAQTWAAVWYTAPRGVEIATIGYTGTDVALPAGWEGPRFLSHDADDSTGEIATVAIFDSSLRQVTPATAKRYVSVRVYSNGSAVTPGAGASRRVSQIAMYGNHGLTQRSISGEPGGFFASDVIADVISRAAPLLSYTTGSDGSIEPTAFAIPHLVYREPTTAEFVISDANKYHLYDWGVYDNREFFFRQPDPDRLTWEARLSDGAHMTADGLAAEQIINGVVVTFTDATGVSKTLGPEGGGFDLETNNVLDTSDANPVNSHGIPAKWDNLSLSFPTTDNAALQIGVAYLAERSLATRRGSLTLTGTVQHPTEGKVPVWRVRAGDWIRVTDLNGENATVQRKIISTNYSHAGRSITLELDNTPAKLSAILERVGVHTGITTGGGF